MVYLNVVFVLLFFSHFSLANIEECRKPLRKIAAIVQYNTKKYGESVLALEKKFRFGMNSIEEIRDYLMRDLARYSLLATHEGKTKGYITYHFEKDSLVIERIRVDPDETRKGIGSGLIDGMINQHKNRPRSKIQMTVYKNDKVTLAFLKQYGFFPESENKDTVTLSYFPKAVKLTDGEVTPGILPDKITEADIDTFLSKIPESRREIEDGVEIQAYQPTDKTSLLEIDALKTNSLQKITPEFLDKVAKDKSRGIFCSKLKLGNEKVGQTVGYASYQELGKNILVDHLYGDPRFKLQDSLGEVIHRLLMEKKLKKKNDLLIDVEKTDNDTLNFLYKEGFVLEKERDNKLRLKYSPKTWLFLGE